MVGDNHNAIRLSPMTPDVLRSQVETIYFDLRHEWIRVGDHGAATLQQMDDVEGRRFAHIVDVAFISNAQQMNMRPAERLWSRRSACPECDRPHVPASVR